MSDIEKLRESLGKIAAIASEAAYGHKRKNGSSGRNHSDEEPYEESDYEVPGCSIKAVPKRLLMEAAANAMHINPVNAPLAAPVGSGADFGVMDPLQIAVLTAKYWGSTPRRLTVSFMETTPQGLRSRILEHMNAWTRTGCISFVETSGTGNVRITRAEAGYWSYLGTDIMLIPKNRPTMSLQAFSMNTPESEYRRVVRHETGHTLGFPHEHMRKELIARIDRQKAYRYFLTTQRWDKAMVDAQVLTPLDDRSIFGTAPDQDSIMCYQLPGSITRDGNPIRGGMDINANDYAFGGRIYPRTGSVASAASYGAGDDAVAYSADQEEWPESEDVEVEMGR